MKREPRTIEIAIEKLAAGGDGFGRVDGKACFVPLAAPGDRLEARVVRETSSYLRAEIERIVEPAAGRREPPCAAFGACGGCNLLHLDERDQLEAKARVLSYILGAPVEVVPSPRALGYRCRARMRYRPGPGSGRLGFFGRRGHEVVEAKVCPVLDPALEAVLPYLRDGPLASLGRPADVRLVSGIDGSLALVESAGLLPPEFYDSAVSLVPGVLVGALAAVEGVESVVAGAAHAVLEGGDGEPLHAPVGGFGQANPEVNRELARTIAAWAAAGGYESALELFAGAGNLTVAVAREVGRTVAVELDAGACRLMRENLERRGLGRVEVVEGDALQQYRRAGDGIDLVILDPPRAGARALCREIAAGEHRAVIYVSCDPATLGRDLGELAAGGFRPVEARGFDMFPQTAHVEAAVLLARG